MPLFIYMHMYYMGSSSLAVVAQKENKGLMMQNIFKFNARRKQRKHETKKEEN